MEVFFHYWFKKLSTGKTFCITTEKYYGEPGDIIEGYSDNYEIIDYAEDYKER